MTWDLEGWEMDRHSGDRLTMASFTAPPPGSIRTCDRFLPVSLCPCLYLTPGLYL